MSERIAIIRNRMARNGSSGFVDRVADKLRRGGQHVRIVETEYPGHATELASRIAATREAEVIVAAGGDGTIREVAEGAYGHGAAVGIIPAGTANVLARELGYMAGGRKSSRRVANAILSRDIVDVFPFEVERSGRIQLGLCWAGVGFDAAVLEHVSPDLKAKVGRAAFSLAIFRAMFLEGKMPEINWSSDQASGQTGWGVLSNIRRYAGPFVLTRKTQFSEEGLVCLFSNGRGGLARAWDQLVIAASKQDAHTKSWRLMGTALEIGGEDIPVQVDGDMIGSGRVTVRPLERPIAFRASAF